MDETDREEARNDSSKIDTPLLVIAVVELLATLRVGPDNICSSCLSTLGRSKFLHLLLAETAESVGRSIDATEEEILVEVQAAVALETASGAETLDARLHAPINVSTGSC
jgi:hypothetical protein